MEKSEPPIESLRSLIPKPGETRPAGRGRETEEEFIPRYVEPPRRAQDVGVRNLKWGVAFLVLALALLATGIFLSGARALVPMVTGLVTFTALWICSRLHLFQQRNGLFVAIALITLLSAMVPLLDRGWSEAHRMAQTAAAEGSQPATTDAATPPPAAEDELPLLSRELGLSTPDLSSGRHVRVLKDSRVLVGRKPYLIKTGEIFPFDQRRDGDVVFQANELRLSLPEDAVEMLSAPAAEKPVAATAPPASPAAGDRDAIAATRRSQADAMSRYPALAQKDSPENRMFVETYEELKKSGSELLEDPGWPLLLADLLAKREGWQRRGASDE